VGQPLKLAQDTDADALLDRSPFALLVGMLLDQQFPMERAFAGPWIISERLGHDLEPAEIADFDPEAFAAILTGPPAVHRYPGSMAGRIQQLARHVVDGYGGRTQALWEGVDSAPELLRRLKALPGFGEQKAKIFLALLAKQRGVEPVGWREVAGGYGEEGSFRSVADVVDGESLAKVRATKQELKRAAKA
jgi:uncharacterized HhH-GPD family protein